VSTPDDDRVARYLATLQDELRNVSPRVRDRVVRDVATRIAARRDDEDVRDVLADVGDPLDIAADVRERHGVRERSSWQEIAAIVLLPFGGVVIPIAGWFVALYFLWSSPVWTVRDKIGATVMLPGGALVPLLLIGRSAYFALALLAPLASSAYLSLRLRNSGL
jgi:HAAS domain-containing protein